MERDEYNRMLQDVQEIECQTGLTILRRFEHRDKNGQLAEAGFASNEGAVFRQYRPFTPETEYAVDMRLYGSIVYRDLTK